MLIDGSLFIALFDLGEPFMRYGNRRLFPNNYRYLLFVFIERSLEMVYGQFIITNAVIEEKLH